MIKDCPNKITSFNCELSYNFSIATRSFSKEEEKCENV